MYTRVLCEEGQFLASEADKEPLVLKLVMIILDVNTYELEKKGDYIAVLSQLSQLLPNHDPVTDDKKSRAGYLKKMFPGYSHFWDFFMDRENKKQFQSSNRLDKLKEIDRNTKLKKYL